ncbi:UNVERIFIED_CONTAM: hypothetical protein FKN15_053471 [Acipenser sinensis]
MGSFERKACFSKHAFSFSIIYRDQEFSVCKTRFENVMHFLVQPESEIIPTPSQASFLSITNQLLPLLTDKLFSQRSLILTVLERMAFKQRFLERSHMFQIAVTRASYKLAHLRTV